MICKICGAEVPDNLTICNNCGEKLEPAINQEETFDVENIADPKEITAKKMMKFSLIIAILIIIVCVIPGFFDAIYSFFIALVCIIPAIIGAITGVIAIINSKKKIKGIILTIFNLLSPVIGFAISFVLYLTIFVIKNM